jgi:hypothetical protein
VPSLAGLLDRNEEKWQSENRRRTVPSAPAASASTNPCRILSLPEWPGSGAIRTVTDVLPLVVIPEMPPTAYPRYASALTAYTIAELALMKPHLASRIWDNEMVTHVMLAVSARAGVWASLNRTPEVPETVTSQAVRWSAKIGSLVVRPAKLDDGTALWRHFLALSPGLPNLTRAVCQTVAGVGPLLFLAGAAQLAQSGEAYAVRYMEKEMSEHLRRNLSKPAVDSIMIDSPHIWDTMTAAAIGGYSASVIRAVAQDNAYITCAYMRCDASPTLEHRLESLMSDTSDAHWGFPDPDAVTETSIRVPAAPAQEDIESVADTEAGYEDEAAFEPAESGQVTPRPILDPDTHNELVSAIRNVPPMPPAVRSIARMAPDDDSVVW